MKSPTHILGSTFFDRPVVAVAEDLLGKFLVRRFDDGAICSFMINEVEAYDGPHDQASHGRFGKTERTLPMFGPPGHFYLYLIYGMYWMLNIVTGPVDYPAAILVRGAGEFVGPGRLTRRLLLDKSFNGYPANPDTGLWFEDHGFIVTKEMIGTSPRIGIDYAGPEWVAKHYRFFLKPKT